MRFPYSGEMRYFMPFYLLINSSYFAKKNATEGATEFVIVPNWPYQSWFATIQSMLIAKPPFLSRNRHLLQLPHLLETIHPLCHKLDLLACPLSCKHYNDMISPGVMKSLFSHGTTPPASNILHISRNGKFSIYNKDIDR